MDIRTGAEIVRNPDGTLTVPVAADRHEGEEGAPAGPSTVTLSPGEGGYDVFGKYYLPRDTVMLPQNQHYQTWDLEGRLTVTPGASINLDKIEQDIREAAKMFKVVRFGYDPFQATQMVGHLDEEGIECVEIGATVKNFSDPMKAVEAAVLDGRLRHNGDPILEWCMGNVVAHYDAKDNIYPRKEADANKIDGAVALIGAMGLALRHEDDSSVYEERGIREL
jgi:phage terminase large subunit-like protein